MRKNAGFTILLTVMVMLTVGHFQFTGQNLGQQAGFITIGQVDSTGIKTGSISNSNLRQGLDGIPIGAASKSTGAFTTLSGIGLTLGLDGDDLTTGQYSGLVDTLTAGEALVFGDLVYMNVAGKMYKAQGDSVASANAEGYALGTISANAVGLFLRYGYIFNSAWTTVQTTGAAIYVSDTAAGVPTTVIPADVGDVVVPIGTCVGTDVMFFNPPGKGQYVVR